MQFDAIKLQIGSFLIPAFRAAMRVVRQNAGAFKVLIKEMVERFSGPIARQRGRVARVARETVAALRHRHAGKAVY